MQDSGTVFCREDGAFGSVVSAKLSVMYDVRCASTCVDNRLLVGCYTCYWSEDRLDLSLHYHGDFKPNLSSEVFNDSLHCLQLETIWTVKTQCNNLDESQISITIWNNSAIASFTYFCLFKSDAPIREDLLLTHFFQKSINSIDLSTTEPKNTENDNKVIVIIVTSIAASVSIFVNVVTIVLWILVKRKQKLKAATKDRRHASDSKDKLMSEEPQTKPLITSLQT